MYWNERISFIVRAMIGKPGPFQIIEDEGRGVVDAPILPPKRRYACPNYETCLSVACALNWDSFTCRGCNGAVSENLCWRAHQELRKDKVANSLCEIPDINYTSNELSEKVVQIVGKR